MTVATAPMLAYWNSQAWAGGRTWPIFIECGLIESPRQDQSEGPCTELSMEYCSGLSASMPTPTCEPPPQCLSLLYAVEPVVFWHGTPLTSNSSQQPSLLRVLVEAARPSWLPSYLSLFDFHLFNAARQATELSSARNIRAQLAPMPLRECVGAAALERALIGHARMNALQESPQTRSRCVQARA